MQLSWHPDPDAPLAAAWDEAWAALDLHPFQHRLLAAARASAYGQGLGFLLGHEAGRLVFGAAVQVRRSAPWPPRLASTRGPWAVSPDLLLEGLRQLQAHSPAGYPRPMALRIDPHLPLPADELEAELAALGFQPSPAEMHQQTIRVDLSRPEAELLASFRTLTRRQLKKADAQGLTSRLAEPDDVEAYLTLHRAAAESKQYGIPAAGWLRTLIESGRGMAVLTEHEGRLVGGSWWAAGSRTMHYLYGATAADFAGPALYQAFWFLFRRAQAQGLAWADLGGLPDAEDGVAFFKRGFGGEEVHFTVERERIEQRLLFAAWTKARSWLGRS